MATMNMELAEMTGAMIGDGCLSVINDRYRKRKTKVALLTGHIKNDYIYYKRIIQPIVKKEFNVNGHLKKRERYNCVCLVMGKSVFEFFEELGFPVGKKLELDFPKVILENQNFAKACVRGIFNTDGTIYRRYSKKYKGHTRIYDYLVIQFKLKSKEVIQRIKFILDWLGIASNRIINDADYYTLRITRQEEIKRFMNLIKPTNKYHVKRYINLPKTNLN